MYPCKLFNFPVKFERFKSSFFTGWTAFRFLWPRQQESLAQTIDLNRRPSARSRFMEPAIAWFIPGVQTGKTRFSVLYHPSKTNMLYKSVQKKSGFVRHFIRLPVRKAKIGLGTFIGCKKQVSIQVRHSCNVILRSAVYRGDLIFYMKGSRSLTTANRRFELT